MLEQFLSILPQELQVPVQEHHPESGEEAVTMLENLERKRNVQIGRDSKTFSSVEALGTVGKPSIQQGTELLSKPVL